MTRARWTRMTLALLALVAGSAASSMSDSPVTDRWNADPEEQYLLDVRLRANRIGDVVRAYPTPEGTCVVFGDFLNTLDVPMKIDLDAQKASGWAFREEYRVSIDRAAGEVTYGSNRDAIATGDIREAAEGWCIATPALARWFALDIDPNMGAATLKVESEAKLPVELAVERRQRAEAMARRAAKADIDYASLPQVKLPYRMWRTPALDVVVAGGATYSADNGTEIDQSAALYASGEVAGMSFDARVATQGGGRLDARVRAYRSDPAGGLLGPMHATHFEVGDLAHGANGIGTRFGNGRGAMITNRPLRRLADFDRVSFDGELPAGWDAELYRNGQLLAFATRTEDGRYLFEDIELTYGDNEVEIVLYGPQGQVRRRTEQVNVGAQQLPPGAAWYYASVSQPARQLFDTRAEKAAIDLQATLAFDHGVDRKTSIGFLAQTLLMEDETVSWVEGAVRRTLGPAYLELSADTNSRGGNSVGARAIAEFGPASVMIASDLRDGPGLDKREQTVRRSHEASVSVPVKIGRQRIPLSGRVGYREFADGSTALNTASRLSFNLDRLHLATEVDWQRSRSANNATAPPVDSVTGRLVGSGRIGPVRLQSRNDFDLSDFRLERSEASAFWSTSDRAAWDLGVTFEPRIDRFRGRLSHVRKFDLASVALTAEAASDGSVAGGINISFALDAGNGRFRPTSQQLARTGAVKARVYRDDNANGVRDEGEPFQTGVSLAAGAAISEPSDEQGEVILAGLPVHQPIAIGIDHASLADPSLTPKDNLRVMVPRPGITGEIEIPLVGAGTVEGMLSNPTGTVEGIEVVLRDRRGAIVARTRSDFDGYFLFDGVAYGTYSVGLAPLTATVLMVEAALDVPAEVSAARPYARLGTIGLVRDGARLADARAPPPIDGLDDSPDGLDGLATLSGNPFDLATIVTGLVGGER